MRATAIAAILFAPLISGCGGSTTTTPSPAVTGYDGTWTGQTSQSQPITFTVGGNQIVQVGFSYTTLGPACSGQGGFAGGGVVDDAGIIQQCGAVQATWTAQRGS